MPYVQRDTSGKVVGLYAWPHPELHATEWLEEDDPDVIAFNIKQSQSNVAPTVKKKKKRT